MAYRPGRPPSGWHVFLSFEECLARHRAAFGRVYTGSALSLVTVAPGPESTTLLPWMPGKTERENKDYSGNKTFDR